MVQNILVNLLNHDFQRLIAISTTEAVEIEVEELELWLRWELIDLSDEFRRNSNLSWCVISQQVDDLARSICVKNVLEVQSKRLLRHLWIPSEEYILRQTSLLPEHWYGASNLDVRNQESAANYHDLFSFTKVSNVASVVDTPGVVPRARSIPHTSWDQGELGVEPVDGALSLRKVSLDQRCEPPAVDLLPNEIAIKR